MNAKFFDLKQEKQDRMINAILKIFAENGYHHASTDDIVKEAHISKGLLFHYFESKLGAYSFAYDYIVRYFTLELSSAIDPSETSYFELMRQIEAAKMQAHKTYPYMMHFLNVCSRENVPEAVLAIEEAKNNYEEAIKSVLSAADMHKIKSNPNYNDYLKMLDCTRNSIVYDNLRENSFNAEMVYNDCVKYISLIEKSI